MITDTSKENIVHPQISILFTHFAQHLKCILPKSKSIFLFLFFQSDRQFSLRTSAHILDSEGFQDTRHKNSKHKTQSDRNSAPRRQLNNNINEIFTLTKSQSSSFINFKVTLSDLEMCSDSRLFFQSRRGLVEKLATPSPLLPCHSSFSNMTATTNLPARATLYFFQSPTSEQ